MLDEMEDFKAGVIAVAVFLAMLWMIVVLMAFCGIPNKAETEAVHKWVCEQQDELIPVEEADDYEDLNCD